MLKKLYNICIIYVLLMQYLQPCAVLAERKITIYENQTGPYYQVDVTDNAVDFINNISQTEISSWAGEFKAYSAERLFQIEAGMQLQFANENDMFFHIWSNYKR